MQLLATIRRESLQLGDTPHWRHPRRPDRLPDYRWAKYTRYGWLFSDLGRLHKAAHIPNRDLVRMIAASARPRGPLPGLPVQALQRLRPWQGIPLPRWQRPRWAFIADTEGLARDPCQGVTHQVLSLLLGRPSLHPRLPGFD